MKCYTEWSGGKSTKDKNRDHDANKASIADSLKSFKKSSKIATARNKDEVK